MGAVSGYMSFLAKSCLVVNACQVVNARLVVGACLVVGAVSGSDLAWHRLGLPGFVWPALVWSGLVRPDA